MKNAFQVFSQEAFRKALLNWIVLSDQPFSVVQEKAFIDLVHILNPDAIIVSDRTLKTDLMELYKTKFEELKAEVAKIPGKISLTLDGWSSKSVLPFIAIRGHWLDENWEYQSKLFDFAHVVGEHSGQNHGTILADCLSRLNIPFAKILGITLDNATNNDTLFDFLEEYGLIAAESHVRCLAHILNLSVQDILRVLRVPESIDDYEAEIDSEVYNFTLSLHIGRYFEITNEITILGS